ncbi:glycosyltransferase family 2 protein [Streptomyces sp. NPDC003077]|uniref:glycosyltransferase family 2 protein n=1 Tax=Streptomyces sp. NPDC003077 TaxID=3154443 RepID=UPI0033A114D4
MRGGTENDRTWWQRAVARGFDPAPAPWGPVTVVRAGETVPPEERERAAKTPEEYEQAAETLASRLPHGGLGVLLPSYVARCDAPAHTTAFHHLRGALAEVRAAHPDLPLTVWLGMQYGPGEYEEALLRLRRLTELAPADTVGFALPGPGKPRTVNAALHLSRHLGHTGWLWTDDDIQLAPGCLPRLVTRFRERGHTGAVGAQLTALSRPSAASRTMDRISGVTVPPDAYPSAACMLVATDVVAGGIPARRLADDGHVLFELLDPDAPDPLHDLEVLPDARGSFYRVSRTHDTLRRLRRSLYSHVTCTSDYPWATSRTYLTRILFHGLWPLAPWDGSGGTARGLKRWTIKAVHLTWFCAVAGELAVRGLAGRPLRQVAWGDEGDFQSPAAEAGPGGGGVRPGRSDGGGGTHADVRTGVG